MKPCVNTSCYYYHDGFYCRPESCGRYVPVGTKLKDIDPSKFKAEYYALFVGSEQVSNGTFEQFKQIIDGYENESVKFAVYGGAMFRTFCIGI